MSNAWTLRSSVLLMVLSSANAVRGPVTYDRPVDLSSLNSFNGSWFSDTELLYMMDYSLEMVKYNVETGVVTTVINRTLMKAIGFSQMTFSADKKWISITDDSKTIYRHSNVATYTLVELETGVKCKLAGGQYVQVIMWAPAGHGIVFVQDNDVFYQSVHCPTPNTQRITDTPDYVFNGIADWVYEEVLEFSKTLWFSPDGKKLVFSTMDDFNVRNILLFEYNEPGTLKSQYVEQVVIKYPKFVAPGNMCVKYRIHGLNESQQYAF